MLVLSGLWVVLALVLCTAYSTLVERYAMATVQRRVGPDYLLFGLLQPLVDGLKLLTKDFNNAYRAWDSTYYIFVGLMLALSLVTWTLLDFDVWTSIVNVGYSTLWVLFIAGVSIYCIVISGMSGSCRYSILGTFRFVFQVLSYEINFSILILVIFGYYMSFHMNSVLSVGYGHWPMLFYFGILIIVLLLGVIETARVPFDLPESESELVSGYNTEYSSVLFALLFLGEYCSIVVYAGLATTIMCGSMSAIFKLLMTSVFASLMISTRCLYARLRYYDVVILAWIHILWLGIGLLCLVTLLIAL